MELLEQRILTDGRLLPGGILKVDNFLNHQMDPQLLQAMAKEFKRLFDGEGINRILTIEASGIAIAILAGLEFQCPVVFAKKSKTKNISDNLYRAEVPSFTHGNVNTAGGTVVGAGVAIEKVFQGGGSQLRSEGLRVESLARIASMDDSGIVFER